MFNLTKDRITALLILGASIFLFVLSFSYPTRASRWPQILLILLMICSVSLLVTSKQEPEKETKEASKLSRIRIIFLVGASFVYIICVNAFGFLTSTFGYLLITPFLLGIRKLTFIIGATLLIGAFTYTVFWEILRVPFPQGALFFAINNLFR